MFSVLLLGFGISILVIEITGVLFALAMCVAAGRNGDD